MNYLNFIFDFDDTLFDTSRIYAREYMKLSKKHGFKDKYEDVYLWLSKYSVQYAISQHDWGYNYKKICRDYRMMRNSSAIAESKPLEGCDELLQNIINRGGKVFLYTDNNAIVYECISKWNMNQYFSDAVFCSSEGLAFKPSPEGLQYLINKNGLIPSECLMIGDRDVDMISCSEAGVDGVLLDWHNYFPDFKSKYRVQSLKDINKLL